jgi:hypothetical protein
MSTIQKLARRMMTPRDIKFGVSKFNTVAWNQRKEAIHNRVKQKQALAHARAVLRKHAEGKAISPKEVDESRRIVRMESKRREEALRRTKQKNEKA